MNAVEIEAAVSHLALQPFDPAEFPYAFLTAFGNRTNTVERFRKGNTNASELPGAVLQRSNIHLAVCSPGRVSETLKALRQRASALRPSFRSASSNLTQPCRAGVSACGRLLIHNRPIFGRSDFARVLQSRRPRLPVNDSK